MKHIFSLAFITLLVLAACTKKDTAQENIANEQDSTAVVVKDSTIIGIASEEFGMSTFSITPEGTDTLLILERTHYDGTEPKIYGDLRPDDKYALTTADNGATLGQVINLTQLQHHVGDFSVCNAKPIINGDTVEVLTLNDKQLSYKTSSGEVVKKP